jgi:hypothetical protein
MGTLHEIDKLKQIENSTAEDLPTIVDRVDWVDNLGS